MARIIAADLEVEILDKDILDGMANSDAVARSRLSFVEEKGSNWLAECFGSWVDQRVVTRSEYAAKLGRVILGTAHEKSALFLGRAAHLFLPRDRGISARLVAPEPQRIAHIAAQRGIDTSEASAIVRDLDRAQREFFEHFFRRDVEDPRSYDVVINMECLTSEEAAALMVHMYRRRFG